MSEIQEGRVAIIELPTRGRQAEPIPDTELVPVVENLAKLDKGQGVTNGRFFEKQHQAQAYGKRLLEAIAERDESYKDKLGLSVLPKEKKNGKAQGPFVVAVRQK